MVVDLLRAEGFRDGLVLGALAALLVLVAGGRYRILHPAAGAIVATLIGLRFTRSLPAALVAAVALLAGASLLAERIPAPAWPRLLVFAPGALLVAIAADSSAPLWLGPFVVLASLAAAAGLGSFLTDQPVRGFAPAVVVLIALGIYATVPETGQVTVVVGALLPAALLGLRRDPPFSRPATAAALAGLLVWAAAMGGQPRPSSVIGAAVCFGVAVVDPLVVRGLRAGGRPAIDGAALPRLVALLIVHAGVVAVGSRVIGLRPSTSDAAVLAGVTLVGVTLLVIAIELGTRTRSGHAR